MEIILKYFFNSKIEKSKESKIFQESKRFGNKNISEWRNGK